MSDRSVNLELEEYANDRALLIHDAIAAVAETKPGDYVNLAISETHGNPDVYLVPILQETFQDQITLRFIDQCGCGGYVYRASKHYGTTPLLHTQ